MDLELLKKLEIPKEQKERNKVLIDALETGNPLLIEFALGIGAEQRVGGAKLLEYAVKQGNLKLVKKQVSYVEGGMTKAMGNAIDNDQIKIGTWLARNGAWMYIHQPRIKNHLQTVTKILRNCPEAGTDIKYGAVLWTMLLDSGTEALEMLLSSMERNAPGAMKDWLVRWADEIVDTDRVDCMEVMVKFGLDVAYINTRHCKKPEMRKFLKEHGARID